MHTKGQQAHIHAYTRIRTQIHISGMYNHLHFYDLYLAAEELLILLRV